MNCLAPVSVALSGRFKLLALLLAPAALFVACQDDPFGPDEGPGPSLHVVVSPSSLIDPGECVDLVAEETVVVGEVCSAARSRTGSGRSFIVFIPVDKRRAERRFGAFRALKTSTGSERSMIHTFSA